MSKIISGLKIHPYQGEVQKFLSKRREGFSELAVDDSQPTVMIRIQMPDGTRLPARFNTSHTVNDVYDFISRSSPELRAGGWVLATTFPNKEHTDKSLVLGDMAEFKKGGTAMVKKIK